MAESASIMVISRWVKIPQPNGTVVMSPVKTLVDGEEIGTRETARILGVSQRTVQQLCDEGVVFVEGKDWRKTPGRCLEHARYKIKLASVMRERMKHEA